MKRERDEKKRVLLNYWRSSCSWRVRIALAFKDLDYEYKAVNLLKGEDCDPEYAKLNPAGVPTLVDEDGTTITQSWAILEYLEERYPAKPLLPRAFDERAHARSIALLIVSGVQPLHNLAMLQRVEKLTDKATKEQYAKDVLNDSLWGVEELLKKHSGKFCVGDTFTLADVCIPPCVYGAVRFGADMSRFPTLMKINETLSKLDFVDRCKPENMPDAVK